MGLDAMIYGLISNWLADRGYIALEKRAGDLVDLYFNALRGGAGARAGAPRAAARKRGAAKSRRG